MLDAGSCEHVLRSSEFNDSLMSRTGLISLLEIAMRVKGDRLYLVAELLTTVQVVYDDASKEDRKELVADDVKDTMKERLMQWADLLLSWGSELPLDTVSRWSRALNSELTAGGFTDLAGELHGRLRDELARTNFWAVPRQNNRFLIKQAFGDQVEIAFKPARGDIEEAGKCLALDRNTAAVFHLMRVMEIGLRALGKSLNDPTLDPATNPSWENILRRGDKELAKYLKDRTPEWRADNEFFSTAQANLRAVKDGWRNKTIHVERNYDPEDAEEVWNAVKAFMRHLSKKLSA